MLGKIGSGNELMTGDDSQPGSRVKKGHGGVLTPPPPAKIEKENVNHSATVL